MIEVKCCILGIVYPKVINRHSCAFDLHLPIPSCLANLLCDGEYSRFHMVLLGPLVPSLLSPRDIVWPNGVLVASSVVPLVPIVSGQVSLSISALLETFCFRSLVS